MIRHIVGLRFRAGTAQSVKDGLMADLRALSGHIDGIIDFRVFPNVSVEPHLVRDFHDVFWFDFRDAKVRDTYLADPVHIDVGARIVAQLEGGADGVHVFDVDMG